MRLKRAALGTILLLTLALGACSTRIEPGHVGIVVNYSGTDRGVDSYPVKTGRVWYNPYSEAILEWPTYVQTAKWTASVNEGKAVDESITFTNKDGMQFAADISLSYHILDSRVPAFYVKFRTADMEAFTHGYLRNVARDKFDTFGGKYSVEQVMGDNAEFIHAVRKAVQDEVEGIGLVIDQLGLISAPRPPASIQAAINSKAEAQQKAQMKQNELQQAQADAAKVVAHAEGDARAKMVWAEAEAASNRKLSESMTPTLLELKRLTTWDGHLPQVNGGSTNPFISLDRK